MKAHYDVVIMGAGMVGSSLAIALLDHAKALSLNIALIEPHTIPTQSSLANYQSSFDSRATALAYGSAKIFQQLSVWQHLQQNAQAIEHIHVSDKGHFGAARLNAQQENVEALGYVVENKWLGEVLFAHIDEHPNREFLDFCQPATVTKVVRNAGKTQLQITTAQQDENITTDLLVMADGGRSSLRETLGIEYTEHNYEQCALICNIAVDRAHKNIAYERFTDTGPIAILPLLNQGKQHRCGLIWTIPESEIATMLALDDHVFISALQQRFGYRAGRIIGVGERYSYPLKLQSVKEQVRSGIAVIGNAAHTLHPIAGQGFNLALRGVAALAEHLVDAARNGKNLGDYTILDAYLQERSADQKATIGFSDASMRMFSNANPVQALIRDIGLQGLDVCPSAKTVFSRMAMGLASPMSNLK